MGFSLSNISLDNLFNHGFNAIQFSIMGMLIVFGGLSIISIYIALLPKILGVPGQLKTKRAASKKTGDENPIAAVAVFDDVRPQRHELFVQVCVISLG